MPRVTITVPDKMPQPYRFPLDRQVVTIGRGSESDIAIDCGSISVRHAEMLRIEGGYELRDQGSTNGIKLDGQRSDTIALRHGATVRLGDVAFDFQLSEEERDALRREKVLDETPERREPDEAPSPETAVAVRKVEAEPHKRAVASSGSGKGFMMFLALLLFALLAFFAGLSIRHYKESGGWLFSAIQARGKTLKASRIVPADPPAPDPSTVTPTPAPTVTPTPDSTVTPTPDPAIVPAPDPAVVPAPDPTVTPTPDPAVVPAPDPTVTPALDPAVNSTVPETSGTAPGQ